MDKPPILKKTWRFYAGLAFLGLATLLPLLALLVPLLRLPPAMSAVVAAPMLAGGPDVLALIAVALLGKDTLRYIIATVKGWVGAAVMVKPVSRVRYYLSLAVMFVSVVPLYLYGYLPQIMPAGDARLYILAVADLCFVVSLLVIGGEFWEKFRRVLIWEGLR